MEIVKLVAQMMILVKQNLECKQLLLGQRKQNKLLGKRRKAKIQKISDYHKAIVAKKLLENI